MRLLRRTAIEVKIWPRAVSEGALGGGREEFLDAPILARASVSYVANALNGNLNALVSAPYGMRAAQTIRLRFPGRPGIAAGDGLSFPGEDAPGWRCVEVNLYPLLTVARLERCAA